MVWAAKRGNRFLEGPRNTDNLGVLFPLDVENHLNDNLLAAEHALKIAKHRIQKFFFSMYRNQSPFYNWFFVQLVVVLGKFFSTITDSSGRAHCYCVP